MQVKVHKGDSIMCTALNFGQNRRYFGRTLDLEYHYNEEVVVTPRGYSFSLKNEGVIRTRFAMIGTAIVVEDYPLYYEAVNEQGLSMAGLHFNENARYFEAQKGKLNLSTYELFPYFLGMYGTVAELRPLLQRLNISNENFSPELPLSPLHWMIADDRECIVVEQTEEGLCVYENPLGVMTNNPTFAYHLDYLEEFQTLTPEYKLISENIDGVCFDCDGYGSLGLPGDYSPTSRFVKAVFLKETACGEYDEPSDAISQFFHVMDAVSMVKGSVITKEGELDMTVYTCCIDTNRGIFYYKTYENNRLSAVRMTTQNKTGTSLERYPLQTRQDICFEN